MEVSDEVPVTERWLSVSAPGSTVLECANCGSDEALLYPSVDHHPSVCPICEVDCVFVSWKQQLVQVVPSKAPEPFTRLLRWCQTNLDEFEFVTVLTSVDELSDALS